MIGFPVPGAAAALFLLTAGIAQAQGRVDVGVLTCRGGEVRGFLVWTEQHLQCRFRDRFGTLHFYAGVIRRVGVDVGAVPRPPLVWGLLAPTRVVGPGDIAGTYVVPDLAELVLWPQ